MTSEVMEDGKGPILHVLVVGFHHKKGCQVIFVWLPSILDFFIERYLNLNKSNTCIMLCIMFYNL